MSRSGESIATPLVRGVLAALATLGTALALAVVPALAAQVAGTASSATALDAILIALNLLVLGHGGGIVLATGTVEGAATLTPLGLTLVLVLLSALALRRAGRALQLVREDGVLRERALRDAGGLLGAYTGVYAAGLAVLAAAGRGTEASPVVASALVSASLVAVVGGLAGVLWSLRRESTATVPGVRVLALLPAPFDAVARALAIAVIGLLASGMALVLVLMLTHVPAQAALHAELSPGIVGGLVLTLLQLALLPLFAVWGLCVLLGGTVSLGSGASLSLGGISTGVLPALPLLAALPQPGPLPGWTRVLLVVPLVPIALGALRLVRETAEADLRTRVTAYLAYPAGVVVSVLLLAGLATGRIGDGRLVNLGPQMGGLVLPLLGLTVLATGVVVGVAGTDLVDRVRGLRDGLRDRVERAEDAEREPAGSEEAPAAGQDGDAPQDAEDDAPRDDAGGEDAGDDEPGDDPDDASDEASVSRP